MSLAFHKHAARRERNMFRYAIYTSLDGQYAVEKSSWSGRAKIPPRFRAMTRTDGTKGGSLWSVISTHRTRPAAERACNKHAKIERSTPC